MFFALSVSFSCLDTFGIVLENLAPGNRKVNGILIPRDLRSARTFIGLPSRMRNAIYSASFVDSATIDCSLEHEITKQPT